MSREQPREDAGPHAFVLRLWLEPREIVGEPPRVRAWVQDLASGESRNVVDVDGLVTFVASRIPGGEAAVRRWLRR